MNMIRKMINIGISGKYLMIITSIFFQLALQLRNS